MNMQKRERGFADGLLSHASTHIPTMALYFAVGHTQYLTVTNVCYHYTKVYDITLKAKYSTIHT